MDRDELFESLFVQYRKAVCYFFGNRGLSREETCDLAQDTFVEVYKSLQRLEHEDQAQPWILTIARNLWLNWLRSRRTAKRDGVAVSIEIPDSGELRPDVESGDAPDALQVLMAKEQREQFRQVLEALPPQMRQCLVFRIDHGLKYREIAALMKIEIQTVKSHLAQAKKRLRDELSNQLDWTGGSDGE